MYQWHVRSIRINLPRSLGLETMREFPGLSSFFPEDIGLKKKEKKMIEIKRKKLEIRRKIYFFNGYSRRTRRWKMKILIKLSFLVFEELFSVATRMKNPKHRVMIKNMSFLQFWCKTPIGLNFFCFEFHAIIGYNTNTILQREWVHQKRKRLNEWCLDIYTSKCTTISIEELFDYSIH